LKVFGAVLNIYKVIHEVIKRTWLENIRRHQAANTMALTGKGLLLRTSSNDNPGGIALSEPLARATYLAQSEALIGLVGLEM
jgi:hypothetical protein